MSPSMICAFLCFGDWGKRDLIDMPEIVAVIHTSRLGKKHARSNSQSSEPESGSDIIYV